jgi:hypothetical protein
VVEILQNEPELVLHLLARTGMHLQLGERVATTLADSNLSDRDTNGDDNLVRNLFSDNVFVFEGDGRGVAVIAEVQTDRPDTKRSFSWPAYVANARRRHGCDTLLMIFAVTKGCGPRQRAGNPYRSSRMEPYPAGIWDRQDAWYSPAWRAIRCGTGPPTRHLRRYENPWRC